MSAATAIAGQIASSIMKNQSNMAPTVAQIPTEISAATISAKTDDIFKNIGEKLCGSISDIVKEKQYVIIENINKTITSHLDTDSVKEVIKNKIEDILNKIPNEEELIKSVNEKIKSVVDMEIERTLENPETFNKLKEKLNSITRISGGTRKYKSNKSNRNKLNKRKKSLKRKQ
jgi:F0F1-type ATP synthase gamma subunit